MPFPILSVIVFTPILTGVWPAWILNVINWAVVTFYAQF